MSETDEKPRCETCKNWSLGDVWFGTCEMLISKKFWDGESLDRHVRTRKDYCCMAFAPKEGWVEEKKEDPTERECCRKALEEAAERLLSFMVLKETKRFGEFRWEANVYATSEENLRMIVKAVIVGKYDKV